MITMELNKTEIMNNFGDLFDLTQNSDNYNDPEIETIDEDDPELPDLEGEISELPGQLTMQEDNENV